MSWDAGEVVKCKIGTTQQKRLQPWTADHAATWHETAGAYVIAARCGFDDHRIQNVGVVVVIGWKHKHEWRIAHSKSGEHGPVSAAAAVTNECKGERAECVSVVTDCWKRVVVFAVVADQHPVWRLHLARDRAQCRHDIRTLVVYRDDNLEALPCGID